MSTKSKSKKSTIAGDYSDNVHEPVFDGCTDAPYDKQQADTDISKKIQDVIELEYPRTRVGTDGWLHAILCELIRARLSK